MKKTMSFPKLARTELKSITGGGTMMKSMRVCGPSCRTGLGAFKCNMLGCACLGEVCGFE